MYHVAGRGAAIGKRDAVMRALAERGIETREGFIPANMQQIFQGQGWTRADERSEEHTSELQSRSDLVCRLLLEKKNTSDLRNAPRGGQRVGALHSRPRPGAPGRRS